MCITIDWGKVQQDLNGFEFSNKWVYNRLVDRSLNTSNL
jgi:hypothetical protein